MQQKQSACLTSRVAHHSTSRATKLLDRNHFCSSAILTLSPSCDLSFSTLF